ncbi:S9 family peptidase [Arundinibacter roseus]|uniref:S9 family peptidase n=1 Tax=Arundinibacter roseus TaxID=2070510 RepID=A0A4R4JU55_9BACT|nr:S9 family peptidase [Arundinibacter roseus]TDB58214.1 S9 family peptidase [Arundinibacter roseus]
MKQLTLALTLLTTLVQAQKKPVTLEEIYGSRAATFTAKSVSGVNWMKEGGFYTSLQGDKVVKFSLTTGEAVDTLFDPQVTTVSGSTQKISLQGYQLSSDERKMLLRTEVEPIYRRSSKAETYIFDLNTNTLEKLSPNGKQMYATLSPDGTKAAFVRDNNLFVKDLTTNSETAITKDGSKNSIINGAADWVYEEEFSMSKAFEWSPDSRRVAFYRFDETAVPEYNMQLWGELYPKDYRFKYPKAGDANATIQILVHDLPSAKTTVMQLGSETDQYIPRINWTQSSDLLSIRRMNRLQNQLDILHADVATGQTKVVLSEKSETYVDLNFTDDLTYLANGTQFIYSSESSGYKHLYLYDLNGLLLRQLTTGGWEVDDFIGIDEAKNLIYFTSTAVSPLERHLYRLDISVPKRITRRYKAPEPVLMTPEKGTHRMLMSPDFQFYLDYASSATSVPQVSLRKAPSGELVRMLETNAALQKTVEEYQVVLPEFFQFTTTQGHALNGWMIKPAQFDQTKKYPVVMFVYGGPGSQTVTNSWGSRDFFWYQTLADKGFIIVSVDNRGTGARGKEFRTSTYAQLGKLETQDQIEGAKYLGTLPYVDKGRIGIWGWSYGGYMSSLCMTVGADYFKAGIAVAPVTTWRFYDSIYTERYLKRPQDNAAGYDDNSPINHAEKLKGSFLLIHGTGDDNVHFQNSVEFVQALIKANRNFETFYYPNRNHGISGGNTRLHLYQMMTKFWEKNL